MHADDLVKEYHRCHPLESSKTKASRGMKRLAHALQLFITTPSPAQKIAAWLLQTSQMTTLPLTPTNPHQGSKYLPRVSIHPWQPPLSRSFRKCSQESTWSTLDDSYETSYNSCNCIGNRATTKKFPLAALGWVLMGATLQSPTLLQTSLCMTGTLWVLFEHIPF